MDSMASGLSILNPHPAKLPGPSLLHDLVARDAASNRPAIQYLSPINVVETFSYAELHERSDALARHLRQVREATSPSNDSMFIIPVFIEQSPDLYIAELAALKAGAAFCPLPIDAPAERLRFICQDIQTSLVLTVKRLRVKLPAMEATVIVAVDDSIPSTQSAPLPVNISPCQPAYVMYTSGSTGLPKGVLLSHSAATQALLAHDRHIPQFHRFLQFASPTFDVSVFEIFFPLFRGCTLVCGERRRLLTDLPGFINSMEIDAVELTPSVASNLIRGRDNVPNLKLLLTIGEMLKRDVVEAFGGANGENSILYGMYGPTEATIHCTLQVQCPKDMSVRNIGCPLDTVSAFIIAPAPSGQDGDTSVHILPPDEEGELAVGGSQLADGYLNRPEQTTRAFVNHPQHGRLYRTGDRAKLTSEGILECLGRLSGGQIKLRGQRIELGEIEYAAARTPGCQTVIADVVEGALVAFCVCIDRTVTEAKILDECRKWLSAYMVPADVLILDELPYLDSGKADRKALQALWLQAKPPIIGQAIEASPRLRAIMDAASRILQTTVNPQTRLSSVGLDSLTAIRLASELTKTGCPRPSATDLISSQTVHEIEDLLDSMERHRHVNSSPAAKDVQISRESRMQALKKADMDDDDVEDMFVASPTQASMLAETMRNSQAYCNYVELGVPSSYSVADISRSLRQLARQHSLLRAGFVPIENHASTHAVVVWKELQLSQIQHVKTAERDYTITCEQDLLRPCSFQVVVDETCTRITVRIHHSLYDQWSMDILWNDLSRLLDGQTLMPPTSFRDVAAQYHSHQATRRYALDMEFWNDYFRDFSPSLFPGVSGNSFPGHIERTPRQALDLSFSNLKHKCSSSGFTPAAVFQTAMAYLFSSMTAAEDVTYGVVYSGRHLPVNGIENVFGPCLNTLPLRLDLSTTRTCSELMHLAHSTNQKLQSHALTALSHIKSSIKDLCEVRLFDSLFIWQESTHHEEQDAVVEINTMDHHEFSFVLELFPSDDRVDARITYRDDLITESQVQIFLQQLNSIVQHIIGQPGSNVEDLHRHLPSGLLSIANPTPSALSNGQHLFAALEHFANTLPTSPAVVFADSFGGLTNDIQTLTYRDLHQNSNALAQHFQTVGILPGDLVCICMEKSVHLYVSIIATIKAGAGYLPLVPETPRGRIKSILQQSAVKFCVCDNERAVEFDQFDGLTVMDVTSLSLLQREQLNYQHRIENDNIAYTCFTSGSTGKPKGVAVTVRNLLGNLEALKELYQTKPGDRILQACSQAFDVSVFEMFFAFHTGMCLCSARKDVLFQDLESSIRKLNVSHLSLTPTVAALVKPSNVPTVKFLVTAGEGVTRVVHREWADKGLHQGYGPSETTNICTVRMNTTHDDALGKIGPPLRNTSAFVLSPGKRFEILPMGALGEFAFGGEQVFRGYVGHADLNREKIIDHPQYGRIYKSGDLGRLLPDGSLLINGRIDDQVKVRGNRVELGEINAKVLEDPNVQDCTTLLLGQTSAEQTLVSYVVLKGLVSADTEQSLLTTTLDHVLIRRLYEFLESTLPPYMIPGKILPVTHLPLTSQGKLDRRLLHSTLENLDSETSQKLNFVAADSDSPDEWTDQERQIAGALALTLDIPEANITRNISFFALGLNSLTAISFARALANNLKAAVKVSTILQQRTVSRLASATSEHDRVKPLANGHASSTTLLPQDLIRAVRGSWDPSLGEIEHVLPCTPLQEAMLSASAFATHSSYCNTTVFRIDGDVSRLTKCWEDMIRRHEILRTRFMTTEHKAYPYVQVVVEQLMHPVIEDRGWVNPTNLQDVEHLTHIDRLHPLRIIVSHDDKTTGLTLHMHHAIYDGVSMSLLMKEVEDLYHEREIPQPMSLIPFLAEMQKHTGDEATAFWSAHLDGFQAKPFPASRDYADDAFSACRKLAIPRSDVTAYQKRHSISELAIFQTSLAKVLSYLQDLPDICFGNVVSGRTVPVDGVDSLIAPCFNTVPVRVDLRKVNSNLDLALKMNAHNVDVLGYQLTSLRRMQALSDSPELHLFDALLLLQPVPRELDHGIWRIIEDTGAMDLPIVFEITPNAGRYSVSLHTQSRFLSPQSAEDILDVFTNSISSVLHFANGAIDVRSESDTSSIAGILARTRGSYNTIAQRGGEAIDPAEETIREVFATLAGVDKTAVGRQTSMYQIGLDSLNAAQVAARLRPLGVNVDATEVMEAMNPQALATLASKKLSTPSTEDDMDFDEFEQRHLPTILEHYALPQSSLEMIRPCTSIQSGLIAQSVHSEGRLYVNHISFAVPSSIEQTDLNRAWSAVMEKHQVLRAGFHHVQDRDIFHAISITQFKSASLPMFEAGRQSTIDQLEVQATKLIMENLSTQAWVVTTQLAAESRTMILSIHHGLYDADGLRLILFDLSRAIRSLSLEPATSIDRKLSSLITATREGRVAGSTFWKAALRDANISHFPSLTPTAVKSDRLKTVEHSLGIRVSTLERFCRQQRATIQAVGQTTWAILLAAYTGETHVLFGTVISAHPSSPGDNVAFPSITTIPVPCDTNGNPNEVLRRMMDFNAGAHRHRYTPLSEMQRHAGHPGEQLFDTVFVYQKAATSGFGIEWSLLRETAPVDYSISIEFEVGPEGNLNLRLTFDEQRIPYDHARLLLQQFDQTLQDLIARPPTAPMNILSNLPPKYRTLPSESNSLHGLVEQSVKRYPGRVALEFIVASTTGSHTIKAWTYAELDHRAAQVASLLQRSGARPKDTIAVCMNKSPEASFAFFGILKAGCAFLAIDPELPESRKEFVLQDSGARVLLVGQDGPQRAKAFGVSCIQLSEQTLQTVATIDNSTTLVEGQDTCYCLYTSGTTGTPKGCELSHENAVQAMMAFQRLFAGRWTEHSRWLQFASYWFDVSVLEQFWSWTVGITVVGAPRDLVLEDIPGFIDQFRITHIDLTPSLARLVQSEDVSSLWDGVFITGGEPLKQEIIDAWGPKKTICNGYGPTETTIGVTMNPFVGVDAKPSNIGRQFDNVGTYVLHPGTDEVVMKGAIGELCVSGKLVGKGYLNRPDLTAAAFPYLSRLGERVYRTGDLVRMLSDGSFLFIGRKDSQTKLRGQRLEVAEIDTILLQAASHVAHAVSLVIKASELGRETLVSFFTNNAIKGTDDLTLDITKEAAFRSKRMRAACVNRLPGYMVPTHIIPITFLPLTVNNKTDDKRLARLFNSCSMKDLQHLQTDEDDDRSLNETEQTICDELYSILRIDNLDISPRSNIFSLGLSSISAIPLATSLKRRGFSKAHVATVMANPTLVQLSNALTEPCSNDQTGTLHQARLSLAAFTQRWRGFASKSLGIPLGNLEAVLPCTPLQQGLVLESLNDENRPYFNSFYYRVEKSDVMSLLRSFQTLVDHVQVLRARFIQTEDGFAQVILRNDQLRTSNTSCQKVEAQPLLEDKNLQWTSRNHEGLVSPFEIHVVQTAEQAVLAVFIHHALYDGISFEAMLKHVAKINSSSCGAVDFGPRFTDALAHGPLLPTNGKAFWTQHFTSTGNASLLRIGAREKTEHPSISMDLQVEDTTNLERARKLLGVSHQAVVQACFEIALRKHVPTAQTYGMVVSGRSIEFEGADRVLGPMFNTLPQNMLLQADSSLSQHIFKRHAMNVELLPFQHTPLRDIKKWCGDGPSDPLFDILFVFQHQMYASETTYADMMEPLPMDSRADYPLACEVDLRPDGTMMITLLVQSMFFDQVQLEDFLATFNKAIGDISSDRPISELYDIISTDSVTNGHVPQDVAAQANGVAKFEWSEQANTIRQAVASLAGIDSDDINEHTTLFSVGLDSIDAVKLSSRLRKTGLGLPVSQILKAQTIPKILQAMELDTSKYTTDDSEALLESIEAELTASSLSLVQGIRGVERILPATPQQEGLLADMLRTEFREYFNHDVLRLRPNVDVDRMKAAWQTVVDGTPILRTVFVEVPDPDLSSTYAQVVLQNCTLRFDHCRRGSLASLESVFDGIRADVRQHVETAPPFRVTFVEIKDEQYMVLSLSHAQYDGHSLSLLHEDLKRAYQKAYSVRPAYDDAVESALTANNEEARSFWTGVLSGVNPQPFPSSATVEHSPSVHRAEKEATIGAATVREFCRTNGVSLQALAQTCWALTLAHYTRSAEVLFGVVLACRDTAEAQEVMFPTMNTVVVRSSLHGSRAEMLQYMQSIVTDTIPYQKTPLRTIQAAAAGKQSSSLVDTLFIYQKRPTPRKLLAAPLYDSIDGSSDVQYPVAVEMEDTAEKLYIRAACKSDVLNQAGTMRLLDSMGRVLEAMITSPHEPTVAFEDELVSLCGLKSIRLHTTENFPKDEKDRIDEHTGSTSYGNATLQGILEALAQVSKVPMEQLKSTSTVESVGIDSISAIKVAALLRRKDIHISVSELIRARTAARIAEISKTSHTARGASLTGEHSDRTLAQRVQHCNISQVLAKANVDEADVDTIMPATAGQTYMLSMWQKTGGQVFYPTFSYQLHGQASLEQIKEAWAAIIAKHAVLRTAFCATEHEQTPIVQVVLRNPTDSIHQPMVALQPSRYKEGWKLDLKIHHALYDAVSLSILMQDLQDLLANTMPSDSSLRFQDYIAPTIASTAAEGCEKFWTQYLQNINPTGLLQPPLDGPQKRVEIFQPALFGEADTLELLARKESTSTQGFLFAAYAKVYSSLTTARETSKLDGNEENSNDVVLGIYLSNRSHLADLDTLPAPTVNLVPLLVRSPQRKSLVELAREIQADLAKIGTLVNSAVALWEIAKWSGVKVDTFVNFLKLPEQEASDEKMEAVIVQSDEETFEARRKVVEPDAEANFELPRELRGLEVKGYAYQHSVDVEMTVTKDGKLDVGLFGPEAMLSLSDAETAIEEFRGLLDRVIGNAGK